MSKRAKHDISFTVSREEGRTRRESTESQPSSHHQLRSTKHGQPAARDPANPSACLQVRTYGQTALPCPTLCTVATGRLFGQSHPVRAKISAPDQHPSRHVTLGYLAGVGLGSHGVPRYCTVRQIVPCAVPSGAAPNLA